MKSFYQQKEDAAKCLIAKVKIEHKLTDEQLAKAIGMKFNTFNKKKSNPGTLRLDQLWAIEKLANMERK